MAILNLNGGGRWRDVLGIQADIQRVVGDTER